MDPLDTVFRHLDTWRHLPAYQLERRADVFFSVYLKDVVEAFTGVPLEDELIPELPIKCSLVRADRYGDSSVKVDYALFAKDRSRVFFIELKTDGASRRDEQDKDLEAAAGISFRPIVEGVRSIVLKTKAHQKYHHLTSALARLGYLNLPADLVDHLYPKPRPGLRSKMEKITVSDIESRVEVIYVQPTATDGTRCIDFEHFAAHVAMFDDPFSKRFAEHLRAWREPAGARVPLWAPK